MRRFATGILISTALTIAHQRTFRSSADNLQWQTVGNQFTAFAQAHPAMVPTITPRTFWSRLSKVAAEEFGSLLSRRSFARLATSLPIQAMDRSRTALLRRAGVSIGPRSLVQGPLLVTGSSDNPCLKLSIGTFSLISGALHCDIGAPIRIGDRVRIGHNVSLLTVDHELGAGDMRSGVTKFGPIEIGDGAWLASHVMVLPGVRIGAGAIVAAGSVVTRDVPDNTLVLGVPARVARDLTGGDDDEPELQSPLSHRRFLRQA